MIYDYCAFNGDFIMQKIILFIFAALVLFQTETILGMKKQLNSRDCCEVCERKLVTPQLIEWNDREFCHKFCFAIEKKQCNHKFCTSCIEWESVPPRIVCPVCKTPTVEE